MMKFGVGGFTSFCRQSKLGIKKLAEMTQKEFDQRSRLIKYICFTNDS